MFTWPQCFGPSGTPHWEHTVEKGAHRVVTRKRRQRRQQERVPRAFNMCASGETSNLTNVGKFLKRAPTSRIKIRIGNNGEKLSTCFDNSMRVIELNLPYRQKRVYLLTCICAHSHIYYVCSTHTQAHTHMLLYKICQYVYTGTHMYVVLTHMFMLLYKICQCTVILFFKSIVYVPTPISLHFSHSAKWERHQKRQ